MTLLNPLVEQRIREIVREEMAAAEVEHYVRTREIVTNSIRAERGRSSRRALR